MKLEAQIGATSNILQVFIRDTASVTGAGKTGLVFNSGSLTAYFHRDTDTAATAISLVTMTVGTFTSSGFKEIDSTNMPGWYQFCPPNTAFASGAKSVAFHLQGASGMVPCTLEMQLTGYDPNSATVLLSAGTGTGQLDFTSGVVKSNLAQILGTALTETAGQLAAAFKQFFNIGSPTSTMNTITLVTTTTNLTNSPSGIPTANQNADALLDRANAIETGWTPRQIIRVMASALAGKSSGAAGNAPVFRAIDDSKDRITAVNNAAGDRTAVTSDGT